MLLPYCVFFYVQLFIHTLLAFISNFYIIDMSLLINVFNAFNKLNDVNPV